MLPRFTFTKIKMRSINTLTREGSHDYPPTDENFHLRYPRSDSLFVGPSLTTLCLSRVLVGRYGVETFLLSPSFTDTGLTVPHPERNTDGRRGLVTSLQTGFQGRSDTVQSSSGLNSQRHNVEETATGLRSLTTVLSGKQEW